MSSAVDASENIYITGIFDSPTISFGSTILTNTNPGTNSFDIFLAKYDTSGNVLWAKSAGGTGRDDASSFAVDASKNIYLTGSFSSPTISFGSIILTNTGSDDIFLTKLGNVTGVGELGNVPNISIFPNPTNGIFTIKSEEKTSTIEIENILGEKIYSSTIHFNKSEIDLSNRPNGIYFIQLKTEQGIVSKKIIISK